MKKLKIVLWVIIIGFIAIIFFSNKDYLLAKQVLQIDLLYADPFHTTELPNAVFFLVFFLTGFLIAYFISLSARFKSKKTIKNLNSAATSQLAEIAALKKELESLQSGSSDHQAEPKEPS
ncbi:MAG: LapA family protein [Desulfobacterales bacterium]|jgi:uncharacterized integral membrane protein